MYMPLRVLVMCGKSYGPAEQLQSKREFPGELVGEVSQRNVHISERKNFAKIQDLLVSPTIFNINGPARPPRPRWGLLHQKSLNQKHVTSFYTKPFTPHAFHTRNLYSTKTCTPEAKAFKLSKPPKDQVSPHLWMTDCLSKAEETGD